LHLFISQARSLLLTFLIGSFETGSKHYFWNTTDNRDSRTVYLQFQANFWTGTSSPENVSGGAIYRQDY
ncbi:hypothetical protein, partial [Leptospira borgpetersenii]|uniref:hypothetical protein n=1 Tax=Leptospira borgpetersenii TaxID=174 RepID=UPI002953227B